MKKTAVIYWSGTGNTETMANAVLEGMTAAGADAALLTVDQVSTADLNGYAAIAFGCPAMGSEVLEEMEFQPMFDACKNCLGGKAVALFGSYGWGDGEWMRSWEKDCADAAKGERDQAAQECFARGRRHERAALGGCGRVFARWPTPSAGKMHC